MTRRKGAKRVDRPTRLGTHLALVLDDHDVARDAAEDIVASLGFRAVGVGSQDEALLQLATWRAEGRSACVMLLDLEIPVRPKAIPRIENGTITLRRLQSDYPDLPVIVITGHGDLERGIECMKAGAVDFAAKPLDTLGQKILDVVKSGCETASPGECPNVASKRPGKKATAAVDSGATLHFDGTIKNKLCLVVLNDREAWLGEVQFRALCKLGAAARRSQSVHTGQLGSGKGNHNVVPRMRDELSKHTGLSKVALEDLIPSDGRGRYRLAIPPANITVDARTMRERFAAQLEAFQS